MAFNFGDRVRETATAPGTSSFTLNGAVQGAQSAASILTANGDTAKYTATNGTAWEIGLMMRTSATVYARTEIHFSSNSNLVVNFSSGSVDVFIDFDADYTATRPTEDYLINGNGQVAQITLGSSADDVYSHDQWYALTQTAALTTSQLTDVEDGVSQMIRLTQGQASAQRIGYAQILEGQRCKKLRGKRVTFGGRLRYSNAAAINFAILEWTGTVDAVTSDVVNDWTNGTFTAGNFFNSTTLTVRAVGTLTPSAATLTDWRVSATLGSSLNNIIVLIWTSGTAAQNSTLDLTAQLKRGFVVAPYVFRDYGAEYQLCRRYLRTIAAWPGVASSATDARFSFEHAGMHKAPTPTLSAALTVTDESSSFTQSGASVAAVANTADGGRYQFVNFTGMTANRPLAILTTGGVVRLASQL